MKIAVMGAGSIGGYFGGMLARSGQQVTLIARGDNLRAIRSRGLRVRRDQEEFTLTCPGQVNATDDPALAGPVDLILLTVKTYQNAAAIPALQPLIEDGTTILCLQNGIESYQMAQEAYGPARVLPGVAYIEAGHPEPGVVTQSGDVVRIVFGEEDGQRSTRAVEILQALQRADIQAELSDDIRKTLWTKFLFIATMAGVTALSRQRMAQLMPRPEWYHIVEQCMREIERVARSLNIDLSPSIVPDTLGYIMDSLEEMQASMHTDLMAGRPLELEALTGAVVRAGDSAGMETPINDLIYAMLKPYAMDAPSRDG